MDERLKLDIFVAGTVFLLGIAGTHSASDKGSADETRPVTIDLMTTSSYHIEGYNPGGTIVVVGDPREYYLSDGSKWSTGAGIFQRGLASLDYAHTDGDNIRYVLVLIPSSQGIILGHTDYDQGNHCAQGTLGLVGELQIQAKRGSPIGVMSGLARILSNDLISGCRFNYYSAPVGAVVSFEVTYTLGDGKTFSEGLFNGGFTYSYSGLVDFANPISVPKPISLRIIGPSKVPEDTSVQYTAIAEYDSGIGNKNVTNLAVWQVTPDMYASIDSNGLLITKKLPHSKEEFTVYASYTDVGVTIQEEKKVQCFQNLGPGIIYVDANATGANDGSSWENAYKFLQDALADADSAFKPVEIRVAQGIYKPDQGEYQTPGNRTATFRLINGVIIKGGYAGFGEFDPNACNITLYETILSGDLKRDDGPNFANNSENSLHIVTGSDTNETAVLDGFTIMAGNADGGNTGQEDYTFGGGMYNPNGNLNLANCTFERNSAIGIGGGIFSAGASTLTNCIFIGNLASGGGGMYNYGDSILTDCKFIENSASGEGSMGGAILNQFSSPTLLNCSFINNTAGESSLESSAYQGGGAIYAVDGGNPKLINCTFIKNSAQYYGGTISSIWGDTCVTIINCTFSGNHATAVGGICNQDFGTAIIINSIFWGNYDEGGMGEWAHLGGGSPAVNYSCIQGWTGRLGGVGNIGDDPLLAPDGCHLLVGSFCINGGDPNYVAEPNETDIDGEQRVMLGRVDMGADEFNPIRLGIVSKKRVARTEFVYDCNVTFTNLWPFAVKNVQLEMMQASENMTIIEPNVIFGDIEFKARDTITSIDTCTFQVYRPKPIDPKKIVWQVRCQRADNGMPIELTINSVGYGVLEGAAEGKIDFEDLAELAGEWLQTQGVPSADIAPWPNGDGIINFLDFARLAENWMR